LIRQPEIATRTEVVQMLTEKAREGSIIAMIALEEALRIELPDDMDDDELERILEGGFAHPGSRGAARNA
jgi:hypothetical protein